MDMPEDKKAEAFVLMFCLVFGALAIMEFIVR
jgi:hypothetical protein